MKECDILAIAGIVAEFNPFHNGHKFIIDCAKRDGHTVFTVISGGYNFMSDLRLKIRNKIYTSGNNIVDTKNNNNAIIV